MTVEMCLRCIKLAKIGQALVTLLLFGDYCYFAWLDSMQKYDTTCKCNENIKFSSKTTTRSFRRKLTTEIKRNNINFTFEYYPIRSSQLRYFENGRYSWYNSVSNMSEKYLSVLCSFRNVLHFSKFELQKLKRVNISKTFDNANKIRNFYIECRK